MTDIKREKISSDDLLKKVAEAVSKDMQKEKERYLREAEPVDEGRIPLDEEFLRFARRYDEEHGARKKKESIRRVSRIAAAFLLCVIVMGGITMGVSEAFRLKVFDLIFHEEEGSVSLRPDGRASEEVPEDWSGYWYPEYMPDGCEFITSEEDEARKFMLFMPKDGEYELRIFEYDADSVAMNYDTDFMVMEKVVIGESEGYIFTDELYNNCLVVWQAEDKIIELDADNLTDKELLLKIAKSMKYVE